MGHSVYYFHIYFDFITLSLCSVWCIIVVCFMSPYNLCSTDVSEVCRKFYGQFNNIMSVTGKQSNEISASHLVKRYCLPTLLYGCEADTNLHKINTVWNNCFRRIF